MILRIKKIIMIIAGIVFIATLVLRDITIEFLCQ